jgi:type IV pilus assembly protein PilC
VVDFTYIAINKDGREVKGTVQANDEKNARARLRLDGLQPVSLKKASIFTKDLSIGSGKVKIRDLSIFCRQFTSILNAGVSVVEALKMLGDQTTNKTMKKALYEVRSSVEQGESLADSMAKFPKVFPNMLVTLVEAGEKSGSLEISFERMSKQFEKSAKLSGMVKKAMIYPIMLLVVAFGVVCVMSIFVIPKFAEMFSQMGSELPAITKAVLVISDILMYKWYILMAVAAVLFFGIRAFAKTDVGKLFFSKLAIKAPIFANLNIKSQSAKFARTLSTLVSSGLGISQSLEITAKALTNVLYSNAVNRAKAEVEQGVPLSAPIREATVFPPMVYNMIGIGEETGNLEEMLDKVADYYEEETELATQGLTAAMEPLIIVVMGVIVGTLVLAMYMPMITMYSDIGNA